MLENLGHSVDLATDGGTAVRRIQETEYDPLLMDVHMPGLDGLQATRRIRSLRAIQANVPIIALTASAMENDRQDCLDAGMNDYLSKPISMQALRNVIGRWTSDNRSGADANPPKQSVTGAPENLEHAYI